jgi:hypothetical protein
MTALRPWTATCCAQEETNSGNCLAVLCLLSYGISKNFPVITSKRIRSHLSHRVVNKSYCTKTWTWKRHVNHVNWLLHPENGGDTFLWSVGIYLQGNDIPTTVRTSNLTRCFELFALTDPAEMLFLQVRRRSHTVCLRCTRFLPFLASRDRYWSIKFTRFSSLAGIQSRRERHGQCFMGVSRRQCVAYRTNEALSDTLRLVTPSDAAGHLAKRDNYTAHTWTSANAYV